MLSSLGRRARISAKVFFWTGQHGPMIPPNGADVKPPGLEPSHAEARYRAARPRMRLLVGRYELK